MRLRTSINVDHSTGGHIISHRPIGVLLASIVSFAGLTYAQAEWVNISDATINEITASGKKLPWPGGTAGVVCDPANGDVFMVLSGQGLWKSTDQGGHFARVDNGAIGGRCETSFALNMDPKGDRLACFMLDGKCAITSDGGKTWQPMTDLGRNWDYASVDWSGPGVANILGERHEVGGEVYLSTNAGRTWKMLFKETAFDRAGGLCIFDEKTLVRTWPGHGIERSTDAGLTWTKVSDHQPNGRIAKVSKNIAYWICPAGLLTSHDKGETWEKRGDHCPGSIGPMFDPGNEQRMAVGGADGIFETADGGKTWTRIAALPPKYDVPKPGGWFTNVAWDPARDIFYVSKMGLPTLRLDAKRDRGTSQSTAH